MRCLALCTASSGLQDVAPVPRRLTAICRNFNGLEAGMKGKVVSALETGITELLGDIHEATNLKVLQGKLGDRAYAAALTSAVSYRMTRKRTTASNPGCAVP